MDIGERIGRAVQDAILKSGRRPVGILMGETQMDELDDLLFPDGKTAVQAMNPVREYMGMRLSVQPGVDGIVIVTVGHLPIGMDARHPQTVVSTLVGAHPILF